jgi:hypothetical protein
MKVDIKDGVITMDLARIFDDISDEEKMRLAEAVGCVDLVIKTVVDLIVDDCTEGGGWIGHHAGDALEAARLRVLEARDKVLFQVARDAIHDREHEKARADAHDRWAWNLYKSWPRERERPDLDRWWELFGLTSDVTVREEIKRRMQAYASTASQSIGWELLATEGEEPNHA